jgi:hypothetical protein
LIIVAKCDQNMAMVRDGPGKVKLHFQSRCFDLVNQIVLQIVLVVLRLVFLLGKMCCDVLETLSGAINLGLGTY